MASIVAGGDKKAIGKINWVINIVIDEVIILTRVSDFDQNTHNISSSFFSDTIDFIKKNNRVSGFSIN